MLLNSILSEKVRTVIQSIVYLPHFFSWVVVVSVFHQILGGAGLLSQFTREFGLGAVDVMTNPDTFLFLITSQVVRSEERRVGEEREGLGGGGQWNKEES